MYAKLLTEEEVKFIPGANNKTFDEDHCVPSYTSVSRKGKVTIKFPRELVIEDLLD